MDALCALLLLQALPSSALWGIGWLLLQVFGLRKAGRACSCPSFCKWDGKPDPTHTSEPPAYVEVCALVALHGTL